MTTPPDISTPLIPYPNQTPVTGPQNLGYLNDFIGTWNSPTGTAATGFNVMPLPQTTAPGGYILKNFPYYEEITFSPIAGGAPNRAGSFTQSSGVLFYEQRVFFAPGPGVPASAVDTLIHAENGTWLYHNIGPQLDGPFGPGTVPPPPGGIPAQNPADQYNKQVSVPHGNSLLMLGQAYELGGGIPGYPNPPAMPPFTGGHQPVPDPADALRRAAQGLGNIVRAVRIDVGTQGPGGVSNIPFEQQNGQVLSMWTSWFILYLDDGTTRLQYWQNIVLQFMIGGQPVQFAHVDANTLSKVA
ncbi:heme-binding protein [Massilia sp. W12]|uniref:heme-binding protein n=1 Tax=Massilia sp. W12 TaxID=3126507 RepID=UPI0030D3E387